MTTYIPTIITNDAAERFINNLIAIEKMAGPHCATDIDAEGQSVHASYTTMIARLDSWYSTKGAGPMVVSFHNGAVAFFDQNGSVVRLVA